jgi:hypothetical protein
VVKVVTIGHAEYEFLLENLPLSSAERMPEKLTPASFPGRDVPLSLDFVRVIRDGFVVKAQFRLINHSDKAVRTVSLKLDYLNQAGQSVGNWSNLEHSATAKPQQKDLPLLVGKNATAVIEVQAPFLPANATTVKAVPLKAVFADATEWAGKK